MRCKHRLGSEPRRAWALLLLFLLPCEFAFVCQGSWREAIDLPVRPLGFKCHDHISPGPLCCSVCFCFRACMRTRGRFSPPFPQPLSLALSCLEPCWPESSSSLASVVFMSSLGLEQCQMRFPVKISSGFTFASDLEPTERSPKEPMWFSHRPQGYVFCSYCMKLST